MNQQMRIRYYIMNLIYRNSGKSVKIPSSRELAAQFGVARSTVQLALEKLVRDKYLISKRGSATVTNPHKVFGVLPYEQTPLIGIKLYEGDNFYYGKSLLGALAALSGELVDRKYNIRLMLNAATSPESIQLEANEAYLDGLVLYNTNLEYYKAVCKSIPCVLIRNTPAPGVPACIIQSVDQAAIRLAEFLKQKKRTRIAEVVPQHKYEEEFHICRTLLENDPELVRDEVLFDDVPELLLKNPPDVIFFPESYAELIQDIVEKSGRDILLVARKEPARDMNYKGYYFTFPVERIANIAADMLGKLLAGEKDVPQVTVEADLYCNCKEI